MDNNIYSDIAKRTDGDIYIGVVGPVRTGKSTFIKRFMETLVLPNIESDFRRERATDELPQSSAGRTIMTTEPKFIPEEAVKVNLENNSSFQVRMIDCVGYIVPSSMGYVENDAPRMVRTPWFEQEIPFNMAAEIGTQKVITEHSTIGLVVTTDGSISDIPREEYEEAEQRVIDELNRIKKPFIVLLNCVEPHSKENTALAQKMRESYKVPVLAVNCRELDEDDIKEILKSVLFEFPVKEIAVEMPRWIVSLEKGHWLKSSLYESVMKCAENIVHISQVMNMAAPLKDSCEHICSAQVDGVDLGCGKAKIKIEVNPELFYTILGEKTGLEIDGEAAAHAVYGAACEDKARVREDTGRIGAGCGYGLRHSHADFG